MSSSPNRASNPAGKPKRKDVALDLATARRMLPLVRGIVTEIVGTHAKLAGLVPEQDALERNRRGLDWAARQRRYALADEIAHTEKTLTTAAGELTALGLTLTDPASGQVDFPTKINGRSAAFTWKHGEDQLGHWRYAGEELRRPIPADWQSGTPIRLRAEP
ncbi:MAG: DUF2203 family protein [Gemmataceae bacterium]